MSKCRACGATIRWIRTRTGKSMPCDPQPVPYWLDPRAKGKVVTPAGDVVSCVFMGDMAKATGMGYVPHWATCTKPEMFRERARE